MTRFEYKCRQCGHEFGRLPGLAEKEVRCPRCGSDSLAHSPYLFGTASAEGLVADDYFDVALAPCCNLRYSGWHRSGAPPDTSETDTDKGVGDEDEKRGKKE
ncbi:MAG: Zinc ribbon domain [Dehalococcoidia bacterium]|nr:Zinc ribbon domain [Dehalococcoidia bacterium]